MFSALTKSAETSQHTMSLADYHFCCPVTQYGLLEFDKLHEIAETGYQYIKQQISELMNDPSFDLARTDLSEPELISAYNNYKK